MKYHEPMRTTVDLDDDVSAALAELQRATGMGKSEALNQLVRRGLLGPVDAGRQSFVQASADLGRALVDVTNIGEVLELLDAHDQGQGRGR